jgi:hypothetical protein
MREHVSALRFRLWYQHKHFINLHIPASEDLPCHASEEFADNFQAIMAMFLGDIVGSNRGNNNASTRLLCS